MKVIHNPLVNHMSGTTGSAVLYPGPSKKYSIQRTYAYPKITPNMIDKGKIMKNLRLVWLEASEYWRDDWQTYAQRYYAQYSDNNPYSAPVNNSFGCYYRCMWNWYKSDPTHIDLTTVTVADIVALEAHIITVSDACANGLTPLITPFEDLSAEIQ